MVRPISHPLLQSGHRQSILDVVSSKASRQTRQQADHLRDCRSRAAAVDVARAARPKQSVQRDRASST